MALTAVLSAVLTGALLLPGVGSTPGFDPVAWRAQAGTGSNGRRFMMIDDLEAGKLRPGMTREEVHALLGPPEGSGPGYDSWGLGRRPLGMDYESYDVRYGPDGRVTGFGQVQG